MTKFESGPLHDDELTIGSIIAIHRYNQRSHTKKKRGGTHLCSIVINIHMCTHLPWPALSHCKRHEFLGSRSKVTTWSHTDRICTQFAKSVTSYASIAPQTVIMVR